MTMCTMICSFLTMSNYRLDAKLVICTCMITLMARFTPTEAVAAIPTDSTASFISALA